MVHVTMINRSSPAKSKSHIDCPGAYQYIHSSSSGDTSVVFNWRVRPFCHSWLNVQLFPRQCRQADTIIQAKFPRSRCFSAVVSLERTLCRKRNSRFGHPIQALPSSTYNPLILSKATGVCRNAECLVSLANVSKIKETEWLSCIVRTPQNCYPRHVCPSSQEKWMCGLT